MDNKDIIQQRVQEYFVSGRYNCAMTAVTVLGEQFETPIAPAVVDAAQCLPAEGGAGGLCGIVSGALLFVGVWAGKHGIHRSQCTPTTQALMERLRGRYGSLECAALKREPGCGTLVAEMLCETTDYLRLQLPALLG